MGAARFSWPSRRDLFEIKYGIATAVRTPFCSTAARSKARQRQYTGSLKELHHQLTVLHCQYVRQAAAYPSYPPYPGSHPYRESSIPRITYPQVIPAERIRMSPFWTKYFVANWTGKRKHSRSGWKIYQKLENVGLYIFVEPGNPQVFFEPSLHGPAL